MPFSRHTRRSVFSIGAASLAAAFLFLTPENTHAADTTAKIHILTLDSGSNAIVLESVDDNGQKIFGMVDSGEDWDYPDGSDPRYPLRSGITTSTGYDDEVLSYLDSLGVTSDNLQFYVATHPHSDHIGTGDTIVRLYSPDRVYLLPYFNLSYRTFLHIKSCTYFSFSHSESPCACRASFSTRDVSAI